MPGAVMQGFAERFEGKRRHRRMETAKQLLGQRIGFIAVDILAEKSIDFRQQGMHTAAFGK